MLFDYGCSDIHFYKLLKFSKLCNKYLCTKSAKLTFGICFACFMIKLNYKYA